MSIQSIYVCNDITGFSVHWMSQKESDSGECLYMPIGIATFITELEAQALVDLIKARVMQDHKPFRTISGHKGVSFQKSSEKWSASVNHNGRVVRVGSYYSPLQAAIARQVRLYQMEHPGPATTQPQGETT